MVIWSPCLCLSASAAAGTATPNIVLIVVDTLRADHLPCYGYGKPTAPFISGLARQGTMYRHAYSASSWTAPATASIVTGRYPFVHGVVTGIKATRHMRSEHASVQVNRIPESMETLAEAAKRSGYATYGLAANINICAKMGFNQGFDIFANLCYQRTDESAYTKGDKARHAYAPAEVMNQQLLEWRAALASQKPYFLYIHYNDPHTPYFHRQPWYTKQSGETADSMAAYDSEIRYVDEHIKTLFEAMNWGDNTLVVITADHGEAFLEHGRLTHGKDLYNEVLQVPLIVYGPGANSGAVVDAAVSTVGIYAYLTGIMPGGNQGQGGKGPVLSVNEPAYAHLDRKHDKHVTGLSMLAMVQGPWKYIWTAPASSELYHLGRDPCEQENLAQDEKKRCRAMQDQLFTRVNAAEKEPSQDVTIPLDKQRMDMLRSLGYVD